MHGARGRAQRDELKQRRLLRVEQLGEAALHPVGGERVLRQVIGADAEEVDLGEDLRAP